jgi:hypothetical protein
MVNGPLTPIDYDTIEKNIRWYLDVYKFGHGCVELVDNVEKLLIPKRFYEFCLKYDMKPHQVLNMVVSDFIVRYYNGNNAYEQGMLNRIRLADITEDERQKFLKILLEERHIPND